MCSWASGQQTPPVANCPFPLATIDKTLSEQLPNHVAQRYTGINAAGIINALNKNIDANAEGDTVILVHIPERPEDILILVFNNGCLDGKGLFPNSFIAQLLIEAKSGP